MLKYFYYISCIIVLFFLFFGKVSFAEDKLVAENSIIAPVWFYNNGKFLSYNKFIDIIKQDKQKIAFCNYLLELSEDISEAEKEEVFYECYNDSFMDNYSYYTVFYKVAIFQDQDLNKFKPEITKKNTWKATQDLPFWLHKNFYSYYEFGNDYYLSGNGVAFCDYLIKYVKIFKIVVYDDMGDSFSVKSLSRSECFDLPYNIKYAYYLHIYNYVIIKEEFADTYGSDNPTLDFRRIRGYSTKY